MGKKANKKLRNILKSKKEVKYWKIEKMELDEMWHFVLKKKKAWIWLAVDRSSKIIIDFVIGTER